MKLAMEAIEHVFQCHASGDYVLPSKTVLRWGDPESEKTSGRINAMPGYIGGKYKMAGIKWIGSHPPNVSRNLPRASAVVILNEFETKFPVAIMEGSVISAMRTGAVTGVATKYLSREDSFRVGVVGAGVLSRTHLMAVKTARPNIKEISLFDIDEARAESFAKSVGEELEVEIQVAKSAEETVRDTDIFFTATTTNAPIIKKEWMAEGSFYSQVAGYEAEEDALLQADKLIVDNWEEVLHRGLATPCVAIAKGLFKKEDLYAELRDIVSKKVPGRENDRERIFFNSVGMGIEDVAFGTEILKNAKEKGLGQRLPLF